jgi:integrase
MAMRNSNSLSAAFVRTATAHGAYSDGNGLTLRVDSSGKRWIQRVTIGGKRHNLGLGGYPVVSLAKARTSAVANALAIREGRNLITEKRQAREESRKPDKPTFAHAASRVIELRRPTWRNVKHGAQWTSTLETYAYPIIGQKLVDEVTTADILSVLTPIWVDKAETAARVRQRMETVLDWVVAQGWRQDNPASRSITKALPRVRRLKENYKALPYADVPAALAKVRESTADPSTKLCMEFLILTAVRSGEARMARWNEIDWQERSWTIPPERMKAAREHSVPLSRRAVEVLRAAREISGNDELIFRASRRSKPLSDMTLLRLVQRLEIPCVVHGFRSSFRTWAGELRVADSDVCEAALAHQLDDKTEKAYVRTEFFELRRELMERWAGYITADVDD